MRSALRHALICIALSAPGVAMASEDLMSRPASCVSVMTIQKHGCEVETHMRCGTGKSAFWRQENIDGDGYVSVSHADSRYNVTEFQDGEGLKIVTDSAKSYADLPIDVIKNGKGSLAQIGTMSVWGISKPISLVAQLDAQSTPLELNGRRLDRILGTVVVQMAPPMPPLNGTSMYYYDQPTGVLFEGETEMEWPASDGKIPHTPAAIILPGEPGFDEPHPTYDCGNLSFNHPDIKADQA